MVVPEIVDILTEGDKLVFRWDGSGKMADGTPYHNRYSWAMTFKDGKVVEGTAYLDTALVDTLMDLPDSITRSGIKKRFPRLGEGLRRIGVRAGLFGPVYGLFIG